MWLCMKALTVSYGCIKWSYIGIIANLNIFTLFIVYLYFLLQMYYVSYNHILFSVSHFRQSVPSKTFIPDTLIYLRARHTWV